MYSDTGMAHSLAALHGSVKALVSGLVSRCRQQEAPTARVCVCVYMRVCVYIYIYMYIHTHTCIHKHMCIYIYIYIYTPTYTCIHIITIKYNIIYYRVIARYMSSYYIAHYI